MKVATGHAARPCGPVEMQGAGAGAEAGAGTAETVAAAPDPDFTVLTKEERASTARRGKRKQYNFDRVRAQSPDT